MNQRSDQELIDLLSERTPAGLTPDEIASLREVMKRSPEVREALATEVGLEQAIATHYAPPGIDPAEVASDFERLARARRWQQTRRVYGVAVVALFVVVAFATARFWLPAEQPADPTVAKQPLDGTEAEDNINDGRIPDAVATSTVIDAGSGDSAAKKKAADDAPLAPPLPLDARHYVDAFTTSTTDATQTIKQLFKPLGDAAWDEKPNNMGIKGVYELIDPLRGDQMLRVSFSESSPVVLDLWQGTHGIRLEWRDHRWRGFLTTRPDTDTQEPQTVQLTVTDSFRGAMLGTMPFDLSVRDGRATLSRAGIELVSVASDHFTAKSSSLLVRGSTSFFMADRRRYVELPRDLALAAEPLPDEKFKALADQGVQVAQRDAVTVVSAEPGKEREAATLALPAADAFDVRLRLSGAADGTHLRLQGDADADLGAHIYIFGHSEARFISYGKDGRTRDSARSQSQVVGDAVWLRLVGGLDGVSVMAGHDGEQWFSLGHATYQEKQPTAKRLVLVVPASEEAVEFHVQNGPWVRYTALEQLRQQLKAPTLAESPPDGRGMAAAELIAQAIGAGVDAPVILQAVEELSWRQPAESGRISNNLLHDLLANTMLRELTKGHIEEASDLAESARRLQARHLAGDLKNERSGRQSLDRLLWHGLAHHGEWEALESAVLVHHALAVRADGQPAQKDAGERVIQIARLMLDTARSRRGLAALPLAGQHAPSIEHPLSTRGDRETESVMAEFQAAVDAQQAEQACRLLTSGTLGDSLVSVGSDPDLMRSTSFIIRQAMRTTPQIKEVLRAQYLELGEVRVSRAISSQAIEALESLSLQFHDTAPGTRATLYLADRDLTLGRFFAAASRYDALANLGEGIDAREINAKRRLAWAMLGESRGSAVSGGSFHLGDTVFRGRDFEDMIASLIEQNSQNIRPAAAGTRAADFKPGALAERVLLSLNAVKEDGRLVSDGRRAVAISPKATELINLTTPGTQRLWQDSKGPQQVNEALPLLLDDSMIFRVRKDNRLELWSLGYDGKTRWTVRPDAGVIGDPVLVGRWLFVLSRRQDLGRRTTINLNRIDAANGSVVQTHRVIELGITSDIAAQPPLVTQHGLIFALASTLVATDATGEVQWVRRLPFIPPSMDRALWEGDADPLSLATAGDTLIVAAVGDPSVRGIDLRTGEVLWRQLAPTQHQVVGVIQNVAVFQQAGRLIGFDAVTGQFLWQRLNEPTKARQVTATSEHIIQLTIHEDDTAAVDWIAPKTGKAASTQKLETIAKRHLHALTLDGPRLLVIDRLDNNPARVIAIEPRK